MSREQTPSSGAKPAGSPIGVLVVDDEPMIRELASRTLERRGFAVFQADSGKAAIALLEAKAAAIAVVILDLTMPGLTGEQTLSILSARWPALKVILMSGHNVQGAGAARAPGVAGYIEKPYLPHELLQLVEEVLGL